MWKREIFPRACQTAGFKMAVHCGPEGRISFSHMKMSPHRAVLNFTRFETYNLRVFVGKNSTMLKIQKLVSKIIIYLECGRKLQ